MWNGLLRKFIHFKTVAHELQCSHSLTHSLFSLATVGKQDEEAEADADAERITTTATTGGGCGKKNLGRIGRGEWKVSGEED